MARERRSSRRCLQRFLIRFEDAGEMRLAFSENVSHDGIFLKTRYPPPPGAGLRLLIRTPRGGEVRHGVVIWSRYNFHHPAMPHAGSGAGIHLSPRTQGRITDSPPTGLDPS
jgi:hypothetical protein